MYVQDASIRPATAKREYFLGLDLGQRRDRTAIAILERAEHVIAERDPVTWAPARVTTRDFRYRQRLPLHTPYTTVADHVTLIGSKLAKQGDCTVVVDATGLGMPVVDLLRSANAPWRLMPVTIGYGAGEQYTDGIWRVPKRDLVAGLQLAFEHRDFRIASRLREAEPLMEELTSMRATIRSSGATRYESPGEAHDDLAIAVALAWWGATTRLPGELGVAKRLL
jgi:hypothetical protein